MAFVGMLVSQASAQSPEREILVQGFRSPSMGVEVKDGFLGFSVGVYPTTIDEDSRGRPRTTWFLKTGLTAYVYEFDTGSGRPSSPFVSLALVQGLNNAWNVSESVREGAGIFVDLGFRWAAYRGLDLRMGAGLLVGFDGRWHVRPTPGIGWAMATTRPEGATRPVNP